MRKIIFLDIDGVLNLISQGHDEFGSMYHKHFEDNLRFLVEETGADIVITSTKRTYGVPHLRKMWDARGIAGNIVGITTMERFMQIERGFEIQEYIDDNEIETYVIIDDDEDMLPHQMESFVKTADNHDHPDSVEGYGLTRICAEQAIKILNDE
jgi:predicted mannosyl-3-phosphoglycerate phosphatase (HAD superfamily)